MYVCIMDNNVSHVNVPSSHDPITIQVPNDPFLLSSVTATAATGPSLVSPRRFTETATPIQRQSHGSSSSSSPRGVGFPTGLSSSHRRHGSRRNWKYRGIRCRSGKWVSEIREPRKTTRIWLGTYPAPEMAGAAYDVAALALKGPDASINFPDSIHSYPIPTSTSASDIRAAASMAAEARLPHKLGSVNNPEAHQMTDNVETSSISSAQPLQNRGEFIDEDELLNMPSLLVDMAGGMLVSPPRITSPSSDDSQASSEGDNLWTYT